MASRKQRKIKWEFVGLNGLVLIFVAMLLVYTFVHTGAVLSRYINPSELGYVAALGIEGLVLVLSWRRTFKQGSTRSIDITLGIVLLISAIANLYEGYAVKNGKELLISDLPTLDIIQSIVGVLVTAVIPLLVFMAGEVIGKGVEEFGKFVSSIAEAEIQETTIEIPQVPTCEFCNTPLKDFKPQTRSAHLRYCDVYKAGKIAVHEAELLISANGHVAK